MAQATTVLTDSVPSWKHRPALPLSLWGPAGQGEARQGEPLSTWTTIGTLQHFSLGTGLAAALYLQREKGQEAQPAGDLFPCLWFL